VVSSADYFAADRQALVADVPVHGARTVYAAIGDAFAWVCLAGLAGLAATAFRPRSRPYPRPAPARAPLVSARS
jgi:apolipoprotein N-acyltransferase